MLPARDRMDSILSSMADLLLLTFDLDDTLIDTDAVASSRVGDAVAEAREPLGLAAGIDYDAVAETVIATDPVRVGRAATLLRLL